MGCRMIVVMVLVAAVFAAGCGRKEAKQKAQDKMASDIVSRAVSTASGKDVKVDVKGETVTFKDADGSVTVHTGEDAKVPKAFPKDIPIYTKAEVAAVVNPAENAFSITLRSKDPVSTVAAFYGREMKAKGWKSETALNLANRAILAFKKGGRVAGAMIGTDGKGETVIVLNTGDED